MIAGREILQMNKEASTSGEASAENSKFPINYQWPENKERRKQISYLDSRKRKHQANVS